METDISFEQIRSFRLKVRLLKDSSSECLNLSPGAETLWSTSEIQNMNPDVFHLSLDNMLQLDAQFRAQVFWLQLLDRIKSWKKWFWNQIRVCDPVSVLIWIKPSGYVWDTFDPKPQDDPDPSRRLDDPGWTVQEHNVIKTLKLVKYTNSSLYFTLYTLSV